jgi:hypothetical protein
MTGRIKEMINRIAEQRCQGINAVRATTIVKITLKGVNASQYDENSPDDPEVIARLKTIAKELGVAL